VNRDELDGAILDWLEAHVSATDYGILGETMIVIRRRDRQPLVLVPVASFHRPGEAERRAHAALRRAGIDVLIVRSLADVRLAVEPLIPRRQLPALQLVRYLGLVEPMRWVRAA
jgi:hypothetical protein